MRGTPTPPAWCRTFEQREAWNAGFKAALQSVITEQLALEWKQEDAVFERDDSYYTLFETS